MEMPFCFAFEVGPPAISWICLVDLASFELSGRLHQMIEETKSTLTTEGFNDFIGRNLGRVDAIPDNAREVAIMRHQRRTRTVRCWRTKKNNKEKGWISGVATVVPRRVQFLTVAEADGELASSPWRRTVVMVSFLVAVPTLFSREGLSSGCTQRALGSRRVWEHTVSLERVGWVQHPRFSRHR